jgi:hypothetical protein
MSWWTKAKKQECEINTMYLKRLLAMKSDVLPRAWNQ